MTVQSHPPSLSKLVERTIREEQLIEPGDRVLVAVSGGPDSMALAHVLWRLRERFRCEVLAVGVDHGLRSEAAQELELARTFLGSLGMEFETVNLSVGRGPNLMARARDARLKALRASASKAGACRIAVGHHAEDRAETLVIRLLQGSGPAGLAVLPALSDDLIRPLLRARRVAIQQHLERHQVPFSTDPSNLNRRHLRVAVRLDVLPVLQGLCPRIVEHLCDLADDLAALGPASPTPVLKRAQLKALGQAAAGAHFVRVALPGGSVARFDPNTRAIVVEEGAGNRRRTRSGDPTQK